MWLFTRYGFFSIACASKPSGELDPRALMIRTRQKAHLNNLQARFPTLAGTAIITSLDSDYRYRIVVPKSDWVTTVAELAEEQVWSNFKNEATRLRDSVTREYVSALHEIWSVMYGVQNREDETPLPQRPRQRHSD